MRSPWGVFTVQTNAPLVGVLNCIIAGNSVTGAFPDEGPDVLGGVRSSGDNLIGIADGSFGWVLIGGSADYLGIFANPVNAGLDPAGPTNNGGPTNTIQLANGSLAFRHGSPALAGTQDQRGYTRVNGNGRMVSIGAFDPDAQ